MVITARGWQVFRYLKEMERRKGHKAEATCENGLLRIEVPFIDATEHPVKGAIKAAGAEAETKSIEFAQ